MNVMTSFSENLENDVKSHAPIVYLQNAPEGVEQYLKAYNEKMDLRTVDDEQKVTEEIRDGSADLWIAFPQDFLEQIEVYKTGDEIPQIKVYYNPSEEYSQAAYEGVAGGCLEVTGSTVVRACRRYAVFDSIYGEFRQSGHGNPG